MDENQRINRIVNKISQNARLLSNKTPQQEETFSQMISNMLPSGVRSFFASPKPQPEIKSERRFPIFPPRQERVDSKVQTKTQAPKMQKLSEKKPQPQIIKKNYVSRVKEEEEIPKHYVSRVKEEEEKPKHYVSRVKEEEEKPKHYVSRVKEEEEKPKHYVSRVKEEEKPKNYVPKVKEDEQPKKMPKKKNYIAKDSLKQNQTASNISSQQTYKKTTVSSKLEQFEQTSSNHSYHTEKNYEKPNRGPRPQRGPEQIKQETSLNKGNYNDKDFKSNRNNPNNRNYQGGNNRFLGRQQEREAPQRNQTNFRGRGQAHRFQNNQRSHTTGTKINPNKLVYKNVCDKYLKNFEKLPQNEEQLGLQIKNLKKYFLSSQLTRSYDSKPTDISVLKCLDYPAIFFQYTYQKEKRYMQLRDVDKGTGKKFTDFYQIVKKVYDMHYYSIDVQYEEAFIQFSKIKAKEINLFLALKKRDFKEDFKRKNQKMIYYCLNQHNYAEFIFFDYSMKQVNFGEKYIKDKKKQVDDKYFEDFEKFIKSAKSNDLNEIVGLGEEEVESQNEERNGRDNLYMNVNNELTTTEKRLEELLHADITEIEESLEEKNNEHFDLIQGESTDTQKIERLGEQVDKMTRDIENYKATKYDIEHQLRQLRFKKVKPVQSLEYMRLSLKRIIFAKKQLQSDLPILGKKKQIFELLEKNNLIILEGETGSGKSTQLPQMLCEYYKLFENPNALPVLVTQPRKIATRSLAERVAEQLEQKGGHFVDYVASAGKTHNSKAKIIFKLDRLVLDELVESPTLDEYSCLVIDEAHERTISIDVILGLVKDLLQKRKDFKVIITSASMEISLFERYFNKKTLKVSGRMYPVNIKHLPSKQEQMIKKIEKAIDGELLTERNMLKDKYKGHILVFCADTSEIEALADIFKKKLNHKVFMVIPLHGKLSPEDQKKAFAKTKEHKLIFASRIAETAITIDGIKVVIDPGWDREMQYDQKTKFSSMKLVQISQSSAKQRAGRAGRTQEGFCLRLYTEQEFKNRRFNKLPEIKNIALETLILRLKTLGIDNVSKFDYIERPDEEGMKTSTEILKMIGCLNQNQKITTIGRFLVKIPIEPFLARAIIQGLLMEKALNMQGYKDLNKKYSNLTEPVIEILCMILNAGNLFRISQNFKQLGDYAKYKNFSHEKGDFFFLKNVYDQFKLIMTHDRYELNEWLSKSFLIRKTLLQVRDLVKEIKTIIKQFHIDEKDMKIDIIKCKTKLQRYVNQEDRILSCLTTCFAANMCLYSGHPQIGYTYMNLQKTVQIYGTSCLSLLGICPKYILAYDFYENKDGKLFCKVANEIDYEFLWNTVENYVMEKYEIEKLRDTNPFYKELNYKLQTLTMLQLKQAYDTREYRMEKQAQFLKKLSLSFSETENKVSVFIRCDQKQQKLKQQAENELEKYIQQLKKKANTKYTHNYIGNIFVVIGNGFEIESILFKTIQTIFEMSNLDQQTFSMIKNDWSQMAFVESFGKNKIKIYVDDDSTIACLESYIEFLTQKEGSKITIRKDFADIRKKIPQTKIYLHWFAGTSQRNNILINYGSLNNREQNNKLSEDDIIELTTRQNNYLNEAIEKLKLRNHVLQYRSIAKYTEDQKQLRKLAREINGVKLTKNANGINIFSDSLDQIDLMKLFHKLILTNSINLHFQMPKFIKKFREPQLPACTWRDSKWVEQIEKLLQKVTDRKEPCIRVWGYGLRPKPNEKISQLEKSFRIDMKAEIKTFDGNLLQKMKNNFDDKQEILGHQKLHVTSVFSQSVVGISKKAFDSLKEQYDYNVQNFMKEYPGLVVDYYVKQVRKDDKKSKVYIHVSSQNRQNLLKPVRVLNALFTPKFIALSDSQFRYLNSKEGDKILEGIEVEFYYKIYFGFDRYQRKLKLYCHESWENDIRKTLKQNLAKVNYLDQEISYKGRNLKKIDQKIKEKIKQIDEYNETSEVKKFLAYEIKFSFRKIKIMADIASFNQIRQQILQVKVDQNQKDCPVCFQPMLTPYKLFNCKHSFCWFCISSIIKDFKRGTQMDLKCPFMDQDGKLCNTLINIYDISKILSEQELYQIFDIHISKFVDANLDKYKRCTSPDCEKIFDVQVIKEEKVIDCQLCGKHFCLSCQASHKNFTCQQWKNTLNLSDERLDKLGIKKCPKCGTGIQKNGGCLHMSCKCGEHICWTCGKGFSNPKQCLDHLARDHKGIFDPNNM